MPTSPRQVYVKTRKKHDQLFNTYVMRPIAAVLVAAVSGTPVTPNQLTIINLALFVVAAAMLVALPSWVGGLAAVTLLEASYCFDCADGMLARYRETASKVGHLFDFFTDELKAVLLVGALALRGWRGGGLGPLGSWLPPGSEVFLIGGIVGVAVVASAISLTNFVRRPEVSGRETTVEAFYEATAGEAKARAFSLRTVLGLLATFVRWLNHYPSHIYLWALAGRMDVYLWLYIALNGVYLARGWLGILIRFGRPA